MSSALSVKRSLDSRSFSFGIRIIGVFILR
nr:MAG TPA: hypothetical protein [Caudoviricetes sp.]